VFFPVCSTQANLESRRALSLEDPVKGEPIGFLDQHDTSGRQNYHGLLLSFRRRSPQGVSLNGNYTLSKCEGHPVTSLPNVGTGWANPDDPDYDYGPCSSDRRHLANVTVGYQTPQFGGAMARALASDWRVSGIVRAQAGGPLFISTGQDRALNGNTTNQRPNLVSGDGYGDTSSLNNYLDRASFAQPAFGTFGDSERGALTGPGRWTLDAVVSRMFPVGTNRLEARLEAFNLTNNFLRNDPVTNLQSGTFGRILSAGDPRILQFAIKYVF
jgi:hypothetical protein